MQEQFNQDHVEPLPYGEDGDVYGYRNDATEAEAKEAFRRVWKSNCGEDEPVPDVETGLAYFHKTADGWKFDLQATSGDAQGLVIYHSSTPIK
jgi:hypothetical protein